MLTKKEDAFAKNASSVSVLRYGMLMPYPVFAYCGRLL